MKMTKQQMAEWLAKVLGMKKSGDGLGWWNGSPFECTGDELIAVIYSPDGFFAVWDKCLEEGFQSIEIEVIDIDPDDRETWECRLYDHEATGKDRYEAFYNAVYEAMKEDK